MTLKLNEHTYYVKGMHCASCEILIEKKLLEMSGVKSIDVSLKDGKLLIECEGNPLSAGRLNHLFKEEKYLFSNHPFEREKAPMDDVWMISFVVLLLMIGFFIFRRTELTALINVDSKSSLPTFFLFGIMAGISTCAALVGGLVLSMSKQWNDLYSTEHSFVQKLQPHLLFNVGRLISYGLLGALLGIIGGKLQISPTFTALIIFAISIIMVVLGLQMIGVSAFQKFKFGLPKFITRYIADEAHFKGKYMPFLLGALTFFLPCGFTITAQGLALVSGSPIQAALIMFIFALGTTPTLLAIGVSSVKFSEKPHWAYRFSKIAGIIVLLFAFYNVNAQLNVLGISPRFTNVWNNSTQYNNIELPSIIDGKQILKMDASVIGYTPNYLKVKAGIPVRWEITDKGTSGCTNAVIARGLFDGVVRLTPGETVVQEFTSVNPGKYRFSCWMGMITGTIEVVN